MDGSGAVVAVDQGAGVTVGCGETGVVISQSRAGGTEGQGKVRYRVSTIWKRPPGLTLSVGCMDTALSNFGTDEVALTT